jgi:Protein of unknown function (DUF3297)
MAAKSEKSSKKPSNKPSDKSSEKPPDRLSNDPRSPYYDGESLKRDVGIRFKGVEKTNVSEYCVSEGWIRVEVGKTKDRYGNPLTIKLSGPVEVYFKGKKSD